MAEQETIIPIKIDGQEAITTLKDLKKAIKDNRDALVALGNVEDKDTDKREKQNKIIEDLQKNTKLLNDVMRAGKAQNAESAKSVDIATGSYNELNAELRELRKTFHDMSAAERESQFGEDTIKRINELDVKLKELDGSVGQYQRNVGNYGKTYKESLDSARESTDQLRTGFEAMNGIAILADEDASALTKTIAGFQVVSNLLEGSKGIGGLVEKGKEWVENMKTANSGTKLLTGSVVAETTATGAATTATNLFKKALIATGVGAIVVAIGTLIAHLDDLAKIFGFAGDSAEDFETKNELARESLERFNEDMERELFFLKAEGASEEELIRKRVELTKKAYEDAEDNTEAEQNAWKAYLKALDESVAYDIRKRREAKEEAERVAEEKRQKLIEEAEREAEELKRIAEKEKQNELDKISAIRQRLEDGDKTEIQKLNEKYEAEKALFEKHGEDTTALTDEFHKQKLELRKKNWEEEGALLKVNNGLELEAFKQGQDDIIRVAEETSKKRRTLSEEDAQFAVDVTSSSIDALSGLLGSIAEIYESQGEEDKKAQKKAKKLRIAGATIDMLQGATTAFASAFQLGPIAGPIVGAVNAASVIATGLSNISKIKATPAEGSDGGGVSTSAGAVSAPKVSTPMPVARQLTSASEEDRLNRIAKDQKVYILQSDLEASSADRKAVVQETSF